MAPESLGSASLAPVGQEQGWEFFLRFQVLLYEDRTQEEYLVHDTPFLLPHRFIAMREIFTTKVIDRSIQIGIGLARIFAVVIHSEALPHFDVWRLTC